MKVFFTICSLGLILFLPVSLAAEEQVYEQTNSNLSQYYDTALFQWDYNMFNGLTLNFQNQNSAVMYGIKNSMKTALIQNEDTSQQYNSYRKKTIAGNILTWGGLGAIISGACIPAVWDGQDNTVNTNIAFGLILGGAISEIIGVFVLQSGQENIFEAVNLYNKRKINNYK
jgi:hypothetical protein